MKIIARLSIATIFGCALAAAPARAEKIQAQTPSGQPEAVFAAAPAAVIAKLELACRSIQYFVLTSSSNEVNCANSPGGVGPATAAKPRAALRFTLKDGPDGVLVRASGWQERPAANGSVQRTDFSGAAFHNGAMNILTGQGGQFPEGTIFPNHATMGIRMTRRDLGGQTGYRIEALDAESAGRSAGMSIGDVIVAVAGKTFNAGFTILDALEIAALKDQYKVDYMRNGSRYSATVPTSFRPKSPKPATGK
jgi:hypothetical protein